MRPLLRRVQPFLRLARAAHTSQNNIPPQNSFSAWQYVAGGAAGTVVAYVAYQRFMPAPEPVKLAAQIHPSASVLLQPEAAPPVPVAVTSEALASETVLEPSVGRHASTSEPEDATSAAPLVATSVSEGEPGAEDPGVEGQTAFNPVTGEINWDCPCLGGMAQGSCGQQFRDAFSCFVYSEQEPKGIDCVDKFRLMQDCFREHPEEYAEELADDEEIGEAADDDAGGSSPATEAILQAPGDKADPLQRASDHNAGARLSRDAPAGKGVPPQRDVESKEKIGSGDKA